MAYNTIFVQGDGVRHEAIANAALYPGQLVELMSTGKVRKHATAAGNVYLKAFAVEDDIQGNVINTQYASAALVQYNVAQRGDWVYAYLKEGENVVIGDPLESSGAGDLQKHTIDVASDADSTPTSIYSMAVVAVAREAVDLSGSSGEDPTTRRILVEVV